MLKLFTNALNKVSSVLYQISVKVYELESKIARKLINQLNNEILYMQMKINKNRELISDIQKKYGVYTK